MRILSLSGGGFLGLYTAQVLAGFEQHVQRPIATCFDLIAGTSIGGIIALAIALEVPAETIAEVFERRGRDIFSNRAAPQGRIELGLDVLRFGFRPKYSDLKLREAIEELVAEAKLEDASHRVIVPALNLTKGAPQLFKSPHDKRFENDWQQRWRRFFEQPNGLRYVMTAQVMPPPAAAG